MASTVQTRPSHYETLGLEFGASVDEIARAFAAKMSGIGLRPMAAAAQIYAAYETLRNPEKRRVYDEAIAPKPKPAPLQWTAAAARWNGSPFVTPAGANVSVEGGRNFAPPPPTRARPQPRLEPQPAPFIAASPSEPVRTEAPQTRAQELLRRLEEQRRPEPQPQSSPEPKPRPEPEAHPEARASNPVDVEHVLFRAVEERLNEDEARPRYWNRSAVIIGGFVASVALVGAWAGTVAGGHADAGNSVTMALPKARPAPAPVVSAAVTEPSFSDAQPAIAPGRSADRRMVRLPAVPEQQREAAIEPAPAATDAASIEPAVADATPTAPTLAKLPLPNAVIARTIGRIGYSCGQVASASAVEGQAGVFEVTCTSGHSYRASPVRGRYHFRRLVSR